MVFRWEEFRNRSLLEDDGEYKMIPFNCSINNEHNSALHKICALGKVNTPLVEKFINISPYGINHPDYFDRNALTIACLGSHEIDLKIIKLLCQHGSDVNNIDKNGLTPVTYQITRRNNTHREQIIEILKEYNIDLNKYTHSGKIPIVDIFTYDLGYDGILIAKECVELGGDLTCIDFKSNTTLMTYLMSANINKETVRFLLDNGVNINKKDVNGNTAIMKYCSKTMHISLDIIEVLLEYDSDFESITESLRLYCTTCKPVYMDQEIVKLFIKKGVDMKSLDERNRSIFSCYTKTGTQTLENVISFVDGGSDINNTNIYGETPLGNSLKLFYFDRINKNLKKVCNYLIENGSDVNINISTNNRGILTPLRICLVDNNEEMIHNIVKRVKSISLEYSTALLRYSGLSEITLGTISMLLRETDDIDATENGSTALFKFSRRGYIDIDILRWFMSKKANRYAMNNRLVPSVDMNASEIIERHLGENWYERYCSARYNLCLCRKRLLDTGGDYSTPLNGFMSECGDIIVRLVCEFL